MSPDHKNSQGWGSLTWGGRAALALDGNRQNVVWGGRAALALDGSKQAAVRQWNWTEAKKRLISTLIESSSLIELFHFVRAANPAAM